MHGTSNAAIPPYRRYSPFPANAVRQMIVDKPRSLQVGVTNRSSEEFKSPFFHILAHRIGFGDDAGISAKDLNVLTIGFPSGKNDSV